MSKKHDNHQFTLVKGPFTYSTVTHQGKYMCTTCNKLLKWVSSTEMDVYEKTYKKHMTYSQYRNTLMVG